MFLLVPAYPGCPGQTAVKWLVVVVGLPLKKANFHEVQHYRHQQKQMDQEQLSLAREVQGWLQMLEQLTFEVDSAVK